MKNNIPEIGKTYAFSMMAKQGFLAVIKRQLGFILIMDFTKISAKIGGGRRKNNEDYE